MITNTCATCKRKFPEKRGNILIFAGNLDIFQQNDPQITVFTGYKLAYFASSLPQIQENPPNNPDSSSSVHHLPGAFCWVRTPIPRYAVEHPDKPIADPKTGNAWIGPSDRHIGRIWLSGALWSAVGNSWTTFRTHQNGSVPLTDRFPLSVERIHSWKRRRARAVLSILCVT